MIDKYKSIFNFYKYSTLLNVLIFNKNLFRYIQILFNFFNCVFFLLFEIIFNLSLQNLKFIYGKNFLYL